MKTKKLPKYNPDAYSGVATDYGKEFAIAAFNWRRENKPEEINNATLHAGEPMYFYCHNCGWLSDVKQENYMIRPTHICRECKELKEKGWLE